MNKLNKQHINLAELNELQRVFFRDKSRRNKTYINFTFY